MTTQIIERESIDSDITPAEIARHNYRFSDAIREGSAITAKDEYWGDGETTACAYTAGIIGAQKRGYDLTPKS